MLVAIYLLSLGLLAATASGVLRWRLTPAARIAFALGASFLAYTFWAQGRREPTAELPLGAIGIGLLIGAVLFGAATVRPEGSLWRLGEVFGAGLLTVLFAIPTRIVYVLPLVAAVFGWVLRRASGREVLMEPAPPRVAEP